MFFLVKIIINLKIIMSEVGFEPTPTRVDCDLSALDHSAILTAQWCSTFIEFVAKGEIT